MNIEKMNIAVEGLASIAPTHFQTCHYDFWASAMVIFGKHLPETHRKPHLYLNIWSSEAIDAFLSTLPEQCRNITVRELT